MYNDEYSQKTRLSHIINDVNDIKTWMKIKWNFSIIVFMLYACKWYQFVFHDVPLTSERSALREYQNVKDSYTLWWFCSTRF